MIALLDTSHSLDVCAEELGCEVEQLFTPLTGFRPQHPDKMFAIDNGAYSGFRRDAFLSKLNREMPRRKLCKFVAVPDVVGSALRTLEVFNCWVHRLQAWPLALVAQDGQETQPIPWHQIEAVFIGGTTSWKMSDHATQVIRAAVAIGKWVHVGRVNTPERWTHFENLGVDSVDGTGIGRYSHMRIAIRDRHLAPPSLFDERISA